MDDATSSLLKILKSYFERSKTLDQAWAQAAEVAMMHLTRPGWPGEFLKPTKKVIILEDLKKLSSQFKFSNDVKSLLQFAQHSVAIVLQHTSQKSLLDFEKRRLAGFIRAEQEDGYQDESAAKRGAARFLQTRQREQRQKTYIKPEDNNRLLEMLSLPKSIGAELPKQDIRGLILKSSLADLLKQASCFAPEVLKTVLGEELMRLIKPVGFADKAQRVIMIQTESPSISQEMAFRKLEIIRRLNKLKEFEQVNDIRFTSI